jgi:hypothetical protein
MTNVLIHDFETAWLSSDPTLLNLSVDTQTFTGAGAASNRLIARADAQDQSIEHSLAAPLDLRSFDELRFWVRASEPADGSAAHPFYLEFSYADDADAIEEEHRWFVPIAQTGLWEQRRIGIEADRRGAVRRLRFRCIADRSFVAYLDELLAVHEDMLADVDASLRSQLDEPIAVPGVTDVPLVQGATAGQTQVVLSPADFDVGNRIRIRGGTAGDEVHDVVAISRTASSVTLGFADDDAVTGTFAASAATASLLVPVFDASGEAPTPPRPAILITRLDVREDLQRTPYHTQRDSFRPRGPDSVCSVRPAARAYLMDYQVAIAAPRRAQYAAIQTHILQRVSADRGLRVNGSPSPLWVLQPPAIEDRVPAHLDLEAALYVRIGTRMETASRRELPWVRQAAIDAAPIDAPADREGIVLVV